MTTTPSTNTVVRDIAISIGLAPGETAFNSDIQMYANIAMLDLIQAGVVTSPAIMADTVWSELGYTNTNPKDELIAYFSLIVKLHFDSPPPSMVQTFQATANRVLERLRVEADTRRLEVKKYES